MDNKVLTNAEIISEAKELLDLESDKLLKKSLDISNQSLHQFKGQSGITINNKLASALIRKLRNER